MKGPPSENGQQEYGDSPGVCRPVIDLPMLRLKKFKSLFSCSYSHGVPLAHCYSARVTGRETQNGELSEVLQLVVLGGGLSVVADFFF